MQWLPAVVTQASRRRGRLAPTHSGENVSARYGSCTLAFSETRGSDERAFSAHEWSEQSARRLLASSEELEAKLGRGKDAVPTDD